MKTYMGFNSKNIRAMWGNDCHLSAQVGRHGRLNDDRDARFLVDFSTLKYCFPYHQDTILMISTPFHVAI
jgi:hypothetical protein